MSATDTLHKVVNLYQDQVKTYNGVRKAILEERDDLTEGEIIEELARAYPVHQVMAGEGNHNGAPEDGEIPSMCGLVTETAAEVGDPSFSREQLDAMDSNILRNMAKEASSDTINGRSTKMQIIAYFACPCAKESDGLPE